MASRTMRIVAFVITVLLAFTAPVQAGFYDATVAEMRGAPGSIIRSQPLEFSPLGGLAFRVLYRSTGTRGQPIAVSGVVIRPTGKAPPGGREVVAWAHATTGIARRCAPSLFGVGFGEVPALSLLLSRGYVVVATDYPGLGTDTQHPYLVGESEARAVLDSVRAARAMRDIGAGDRFVVWGHSQGGHAALFTGQLAGRYAPELRLMGIATAAPATHLGELFEHNLNSAAGRILTVLSLAAWSKVYQAPMQTMVFEKELAAVNKIAAGCIETVVGKLGQLEAQKKMSATFLLANPAVARPWADFIDVNTPGKVLAGAPVLIAQGATDKIVDPEVTDAYVAGLCKRGTRVRLIRYPKGSHHTVVKQSATQTVAWIVERFNGAPMRTPCGE